MLEESKLEEFERLFREMLDTYPETKEGKWHIETVPKARLEAKKNFSETVSYTHLTLPTN